MFGDDRPAWARMTGAVRRTSYGGDCYAYGLLALGQIDVIVEAGLKLWDWAAIAPVIAGAGGVLTDWSGQPVRPDSDGRVLAVGDGALLAPAIALLARSAQT
jgi:myo-inositol-1(or 4)-monophosphatase